MATYHHGRHVSAHYRNRLFIDRHIPKKDCEPENPSVIKKIEGIGTVSLREDVWATGKHATWERGLLSCCEFSFIQEEFSFPGKEFSFSGGEFSSNDGKSLMLEGIWRAPLLVRE